MGKDSRPPFRLVIVSPVYEDAASAARLIRELTDEFDGSEVQLRILLVDDRSPTPLAAELQLAGSVRHCPVDLLRLRRNVGHQRAISIGTAYLHDRIPCDAMLVMDADGEDRPEDAAKLVRHCQDIQGGRIIFGERTRRSETRLFLVFYRLYQLMHWVLTGIRVRVGNFSIVPAGFLPTLVTLPEMWNHYAAAIFHSRVPFEMIPTQRGSRYSGKSKMNYLALVMHGLHAISVFSDIVALRFLITLFTFSCGFTVLLFASLMVHLRSSPHLPTWTTYGGGALLFLLLLMLNGFSLLLQLMSQRNSLDFLPIRDYKYFVEDVTRVGPRDE